MRAPFVVDGQRQPKAPPAPALNLRHLAVPPIPQPLVIEDDGDTSWSLWDAAVRRGDGIAEQHEEVRRG